VFVADVQLAGAQVEDAFIYRTALFCWTYDQTLRVYRVADLEAELDAVAGSEGLAASYSLFHSGGVGSSQHQREAFSRLRDASGTTIVLDGSRVPFVESTIEGDSGSVLDMLIYYDRLFLACDGGLFQVDDLAAPLEGLLRLPAKLRVANTCYSASRGLGAVGVSCGSEGLSLLLSVFDDGDELRAASKIADSSIASQIGYGTVVNHLSRPEIEFYACDMRDDPKRGNVITSVEAADTSRSDDVRGLVGDPPDDERSELVFWDYGRLLTFGAGAVSSVSVQRTGNGRHLNKVRAVAELSVSARVISAARSRDCLAVEMTDRIALLSSGPDFELREFFTGPLVSMRTYQSSVRYRRLVSYTSDIGLGLIGAARGRYIEADDYDEK
jgi:hypothetical protein